MIKVGKWIAKHKVLTAECLVKWDTVNVSVRTYRLTFRVTKTKSCLRQALNILNNTKRLSANVGSLFYHEEKDVI